MKLAEEVKITKEKIKEVEEEWQNNLLSWKSKRRQGKRNTTDEEEECEERNSINNSRKIKTFNEILNEKAKSGYRIGYNLHHYLMNEEDNLIENNQIVESKIQIHKSTDQTDNNLSNESNNNQINAREEQASTDDSNLNSQITDDFTNQSKDDELKDVANTNLLKEYSANNLSQNEIAQNNSFLNNEEITNKKINNNNISQTLNNNTKITNKLVTNSKLSSSADNQLKNSIMNVSACSQDELENNKQEESGKKLSFKARLSAFESLAKQDEPKKLLEKTPPIKNKLRMSSSNNLIADKKLLDNEKQEAALSNFAKRYASKSNENLSKLKSSQQDKANVNSAKSNKCSEFLTTTKSESNLNTKLQHSAFKNDETIQSDQQLNNQTHQNQNETNKYDLSNTRSSNESMPNNKETINNLQQQQFDCDYEVSELSKRMQHQMSTSPNLLHQQQQKNLTHSNNHSTSIHSQSTHSTASQQHHFKNSTLDEQSNNQTNNNNNYNNNFNDDYTNSQLYNQQQLPSSHSLINNLPQNNLTDYSQSNQFYQPVANKQTISAILPQNGSFDENVGLYGNYYNTTANLSANAYQLQKHNVCIPFFLKLFNSFFLKYTPFC